MSRSKVGDIQKKQKKIYEMGTSEFFSLSMTILFQSAFELKGRLQKDAKGRKSTSDGTFEKDFSLPGKRAS